MLVSPRSIVGIRSRGIARCLRLFRRVKFLLVARGSTSSVLPWGIAFSSIPLIFLAALSGSDPSGAPHWHFLFFPRMPDLASRERSWYVPFASVSVTPVASDAIVIVW